MNIASIMTCKVLTVGMDDSLKTIRNIFKHAGFHHILVDDGRRLVGVISDRDFLRALSPFLDTPSEQERDTISLNKKAHQIMSKTPVTVDMEASIEEAVSLLLKNRISCLPVVSPQGGIEGIVTWKDILKFYLQKAISNKV